MNYKDFDTLVFCMAFSQLKGLTLITASQIIERIGSEANFFKLSEGELNAVMGFSNRIFSADYRTSLLDRVRKEAEYIEANQISALYFRNDNYPSRLLDCDDAPLMLYTLGSFDLNSTKMISVVGTRHATAYGVDFVNRFVADIAKKCDNRVAIVSGLAYGIDVAAHKAALDNGLPTVAVFGHGLNRIYPAQHRGVAIDIVRKGGLLATEYTTADSPQPGNFLARNRIVAGLSEATLVVESAEKGGSLVTAGIASAYNRDVFALPGRISDKWSVGCNRLISNNSAQLVTSADDFLKAMRWNVKPMDNETPSLFVELNEDESRVLNFLNEHPDTHISQLSVALNLRHGPLNAILLELEFKEMVLRKPGGIYAPA